MTIIYSNCKDVDCSFLPYIWENFDCNVVEITPEMDDFENLVNDAIKNEDDLLIFAGHGSSNGLFHPCFEGYLLESKNVGLIHAKTVICIWCNASTFCKTHGLKCLCSSMFVSNVHEGEWFNMHSTQEHINGIVERFYKELNKCLTEKFTLNETYDYLNKQTDTSDQIDTYNRNGIMLLDE